MQKNPSTTSSSNLIAAAGPPPGSALVANSPVVAAASTTTIEAAFADDHFFVKAYSGTSSGIIQELFRAARESATSGRPEEVAATIANLKDHIIAYVNHLTKEHIETINKEITDTFASHRHLTVMIIEALIDVQYTDYTVKKSRFANLLNAALPADSEREADVIRNCFLLLVKDGGSLTPEIVNAEVVRCFEWLGEPEDELNAHYGACRLLEMFASEVPEIVKPHYVADTFLYLAWNGLCGKTLTVREAALCTLEQFLQNGIAKIGEVSCAMPDVESMLKESAEVDVRYTHGALLMLSVIARFSRNDADLYQRTIDIILDRRYYRVPMCRVTLLRIIPVLPSMSNLFLTCHLNRTLREILYVYTEEGDSDTKSCAFYVMAELITNLGRLGVGPHLNDMMGRVQRALRARGRRRDGAHTPYCNSSPLDQTNGGGGLGDNVDDVTIEAFKCLGEIAKVSDNTWLQPHVEQLMQPLFERGLNSYLTEALNIMGKSMPEFIPMFQEGLLASITRTLRPTYNVGTNSSMLMSTGSMLTLTPMSIVGSTPHHRRVDSDGALLPSTSTHPALLPELREDDRIIAMRTLATFNPRANSNIMSLVSTHLLHFLTDDSVELRVEGVKTTLQLLSAYADPQDTSTSINMDILGKVVDVGVADISEIVRYTVLSNIDPRLDFYLASPDYLETLFMGLHDEKLYVREATLHVLCRLSKLHPAFVIPGLKRIQLQFVAELQHSRNLSHVEHSAKMLLHMVRSGINIEQELRLQGLVLEKLESTAADQLCTTLLELLGGIAYHVGVHVSTNANGEETLFRDVIDAIEDNASQGKRRAALSALVNIVRSTAVVSEPFYQQHPRLLRTLIDFLHGDRKGDWGIRKEVMRLIGTVGAIDPQRAKSLQLMSSADRVDEDGLGQPRRAAERFLERTPLPVRYSANVSENLPAVVLCSVVKVLCGPLTVHYPSAMRAFGTLFRVLTPTQLQPHAQLLVPVFLDVLKIPERRTLHAEALALLNTLMTVLKINKDTFGTRCATDIMARLRQYCDVCELDTSNANTSRVLCNVVALLEEMAKSFTVVVKTEVRWIFSFLVQRMIDDRTDKREISMRVISAFESFVTLIEKDIYYIVPLILNCIKPAAASANGVAINLRSLSFLSIAAQQYNFKEISARTIHHLLRLLEHTQNREVAEACMNVLCDILVALGKLGTKFVPLIDKYARVKNMDHARFERLRKEYEENRAFSELAPRPKTFTPSATPNTDPMMFSLTMHRDVDQLTFANEIGEIMNIPVSSVEVVSITRGMNSTNIEFRFTGANAEKSHAFLLKKFMERTLHSRLRIESAKERPYHARTEIDDRLFKCFSFDAISRVQPSEWAAWMDELCIKLMRFSHDPCIRSLEGLAQEYVIVARDLFPYSFCNVYCSLSQTQCEMIMFALSDVVQRCGKDIMQVLVRLAEFMEPHRNYHTVLLKITPEVEYRTVSRTTASDKFGIGYGDGQDYKPDDAWFHNRVVITRVGEGSPGALGQVPVGAVLLEIDGCEVRRVSEINKLLEGKIKISLKIQRPVRDRYAYDMRPFFDLKSIISATSEANLLAKALHYCEISFIEASEEDNLSDSETSNLLMDLYQQLALPEAASGLLERLFHYSKKHCDSGAEEMVMEKIAVGRGQGAAFEKLQIYSRAIDTYSKRIEDAHDQGMIPDHAAVAGLSRCYKVNGYWQELLTLVKASWDVSNMEQRATLASQSALAAWFLGDWDELNVLSAALPPERVDFFKAITNIHIKNFDAALVNIESCRMVHDQNLSSLVGESYHRAYEVIAELQNLSELEEVIMYMQAEERRPVLRSMWSRRLASLAPIPKLWQTALAIRSLVLKPEDDVESWTKFISICRKWDRPHMAEYALSRLLQMDIRSNLILDISQVVHADGRIVTAYLKHLRHVGHLETALEMLTLYVDQVSQLPDIEKEMRARFHLTLGEWQQEVDVELSGDDVLSAVFKHLDIAKDLDKNSFRAWHSWAMINLHAAARYGDSHQSTLLSDDEPRLRHLVAALQGFVQSVHLSHEVIGMQDVLRILFIWFNHGHNKVLLKEMELGLEKLSLDTWLAVIPQLISRIDIIRTNVRAQIHRLLCRLGAEHPHALIYPLTVCSKSGEDSLRQTAARSVLESVHRAKPVLVEETALISDELIRVAMSWWDRWFEAIENVGRNRGENTNPEVYRTHLGQLMALLENPKTRDEKLCQKSLAAHLTRMWKFVEIGKLNDAWFVLRQVHAKLQEKLQHYPKTILLEEVSPVLAEKVASCVTVPGTYKQKGQEITISGFGKEIRVITSKQRPRRITIRGQDGRDYLFLLKGHEDLRMDERVMQLFGLINTLFENDAHLSSILSITRYSVVPLSENVGLIRWIENTDTIYTLITAYRNLHSIPLFSEVNMMINLADVKHMNDLAAFPKTRKRELLQYVFDNTPSNDLRHIFWERNENSETWLEYRTNFMRSTAMMSIVGYVLGLGDRHLNNIMLHKKGKTIHIDFGDCFEVAMHRDRFPEKVPFRLTRMLVSAMEVAGVEGTFRHMCEAVMRLLRKHRDSVASLLETFAYDPLISWRLETLNDQNSNTKNESSNKKGQYVEGETDASAAAAGQAAAATTTQGAEGAAAVGATGLQEGVINDDAIMSRSMREKSMRSITITGDITDVAKVQAYIESIWNQVALMSPPSASAVVDDATPVVTPILTTNNTAATANGNSNNAAANNDDNTTPTSTPNTTPTATPAPTTQVTASANAAPTPTAATTASAASAADAASTTDADALPSIVNAIQDYISQGNLEMALRCFHDGLRQFPHSDALYLRADDALESFMTFVRMQYGIERKNKTAKVVLGRIRDKLYGTDFESDVTENLAGSAGPAGEPMSYCEQPDIKNNLFLATSYVERTVMVLPFDPPVGGKETKSGGPLDVAAQVRKLISEATSVDNLCVAYTGWCPFW